MRILIIDDDPISRAYLRHWLVQHFPSSTLVEVGGAGCALPQIPELALVLLKLAMPNGQSYTIYKYIQMTWPKVPIILMTESERHSVSLAKQLGAAACVSQSDAPERLGPIIRNLFRAADYDRRSEAQRASNR
jgi:DNA-binding NarL/FixJ family response regulator